MLKQEEPVEPNEDFDVLISSSLNEDTILVTGDNNTYDRIQASIEKKLLSAFNEYDPENKRYSAFLSDKNVDISGFTLERFNELANNAQSNLKSILEINDIVRLFINSDDLIGVTYEAIETNVNTDIRLSYDNKFLESKKQKSKVLEKAKLSIDAFNKQVNLTGIIRNELTLAYCEGTRVLYLRSINNGYVIDSYPLGVAIISDYSINGNPVIMIDIKELENRLKKTQLKNKKGKPLFFESIEKEIEANYPPEVLQAYKEKEKYAILDHNRAKAIRVNNLNRKYGLTPIYRALKYVLMLEAFAKSDNVNSKAMAKKIIFQKLRKEVMGSSFDKKGWEHMSYAHENLAKAFKQGTVLYTGIPQVEDISYVETKTDMININTINSYRSRVMVTLGVSFLNTESGQTVSTANISISQLLLTINKISEQLENIIEDWYRIVLDEQKIGAEFSPKIRVIDSEMMETKLRIELAKLLYTTFNCSRETTFKMVGLDLADEKAKRESENNDNLSEIFAPYHTSYNSSGDTDTTGRPPSPEKTNKTDYDTEYNKTR